MLQHRRCFIIETIWTIAPAFILVFIAIPSLWLLYLIDEIHNPVITLKTVGHQWYWNYEYSDFTKLEFDSYIVQQEDQLINMSVMHSHANTKLKKKIIIIRNKNDSPKFWITNVIRLRIYETDTQKLQSIDSSATLRK